VIRDHLKKPIVDNLRGGTPRRLLSLLLRIERREEAVQVYRWNADRTNRRPSTFTDCVTYWYNATSYATYSAAN